MYEIYLCPIGFPPIPGQKATSPEQGFAAVLETASKLTSNEAEAEDEDEDGKGGEKVTEVSICIKMQIHQIEICLLSLLFFRQIQQR